MKTIKSLITEEIALLSESFIMNDDNFKFKQTVTNSIFNNYDKLSNDNDLNIIQSSININWNIKFWLNDFGIENLIIEIDNLDGYYILEERDKVSDELINNINKNINEIKWNFEYSEVSLSIGGSLYIRSLSFDFQNNTCTVSF